MKSLEKYFTALLLSLVFLLWGCTEKIDLHLDTIDSHIIIEGSISNEHQTHTVKITRTSGYFDSSDPEPVSGALVTIADSVSHFTLTETDPGIYVTPPFAAGIPGRKYELNVEVDNKIYTAESVMPYPSLVDSINFAQDKESSLLFHILLYARESPVPGDHYFFGVFKEGIYQSDNLTKKVFASDQLINGRYLPGLPVQTIEAKPGNRITLQVSSIPEDFYDYCLAVLRVTVYNDNPFEQAPANVPGNISGDGFGFFYAYSETLVTRIITIAN